MSVRGAAGGLLNLAKPAGMTSRDAVDVIQKIVRPTKVGHAGTLDPMATGVLVVGVGAATRLVSYVQDERKTYLARFRLGQTSDTDDVTGELQTVSSDPQISLPQLQEALCRFVGTISQRPPKVSAVRVNGRRAYSLARRGIEFELTERLVEVDSIQLLDYQQNEFDCRIICSGGTYIRSIGRDLGEQLGCGAVMVSLERSAIGRFRVEEAVPLDAINRDTLAGYLQPMTLAVGDMLRQQVTPENMEDLRCGRRIAALVDSTASDGCEVALLDPAGHLRGIGRWIEEANQIQPHLMFLVGQV